jgi:DNA polymerase-1
LDYLLHRAGVHRDNVHTTNVVLCEVDSLDGASGKLARQCCEPRLRKEMEDVQTDTYIAAGAEALDYFSNGKLRLRSRLGKRISDGHGKTLIATYNPAFALRDDVVFPDLLQDFRRAFTPRRDLRYPQVTVWDTPTEAIQALVQLDGYERNGIVAVDIESTGLNATSDVIAVGFSPRNERSMVIGRHGLAHPEVTMALNSYLCSGRQFVYHNGKFDVKLLRAHGINAQVQQDTLLLSYLLDERPGVHSLDYLIQNVLDWDSYEPQSVHDGKKYGFTEQPITRKLKTKVKVDYEGFSDWPGLYKYNGYDTAGSRQLFEILSKRVDGTSSQDVYDRLLIPASNCLADVEAHGVCFNVDEAIRISRSVVQPEMAKHLELCRRISGEATLNLNSHQQVGEFLYEKCGITNPIFRRGKERSVDSVVRQEILRLGSESDRVLQFLRGMERYKKLDKLRGTYLESLAARVDADGRIRCDFLLHGTESGRLSSRNPNLQNVPRGGKDGLPNIRSLFVAPEGRVIVQADYSQAELRTIAVVSGDEHLQEIYRSGKDLHTEVATDLFGANYSKEQRVIAKNYNFGIAYGQQAFSFAQMYHISVAQARRDIDKWWSRFPGVWEWTRSVHKETRQRGELSSAFGRQRRFPLITDQNLDHTLKEAVNFLIQSTASDFTLWSLIRLMSDGQLDLRKCYPIILVHDSIVLECEIGYQAECSKLVQEVMEAAPQQSLEWMDIPFTADVQIGETWGAVA